jgi:two-component system, response regulator PdtaR
MRVLIVEDEPLIAMHLETLVAGLGHQVCGVASSAEAAVAQAAAHRPDVVLMDIRLGAGGSGIEAAGRIHAHDGVRCIFLSANLDDATRAAVRPFDPIAFVGKPILPIRLQRALEEAERQAS